MAGHYTNYTHEIYASDAICKNYISYYDSMAEASRKGSSTSDKIDMLTDWTDVIGTAGSIMGAVKKPSTDMKKLTFTVNNFTPHVIVPSYLELNKDNDNFFAKCNLNIMKPGETSEIEFDVRADTEYEQEKFKFTFAIVGSNGVSNIMTVLVRGDEDKGCFYPSFVWARNYGDGVSFDIPLDSKEKNSLGAVGVWGHEGNISYMVSGTKVPMHHNATVTINFTPGGSYAPPSTEPFETGFTSEKGQLLSDGWSAAETAGKLCWNSIQREAAKKEENGDESTRGMVGLGVSVVSGALNLFTGAKNLKRNDNDGDRTFDVIIKNYTKDVVCVFGADNVHGCYMGCPLIRPGSDATIPTGDKNFEDKEDGPNVNFSVSNGTRTMLVCVHFGKKKYRQVRIAKISFKELDEEDYHWHHDNEGLDLKRTDVEVPFYASPKSEDGLTPEFMMTCTPVSGASQNEVTLFLLN